MSTRRALLLGAPAPNLGGVACATRRSARGDPSWRPSGAMTRALHDHTTRQDLGRIVRHTPQRGAPQQVAIEGPYRRLLFCLEERAPLGDIELDADHLADAAQRLARAHVLRSLAADAGERLESSWELSVHRVESGRLGREPVFRNIAASAPAIRPVRFHVETHELELHAGD